MINLENRQIILASRSPRRKELLEGLGLKFEVRTKETDETYPSKLPFEEVAGYISEKKAKAFIGEILDEEVIISSDTIVVLEGCILGKPSDHAEAKEMLKKLSGKSHQVFTAITIMDNQHIETHTDVSKVFFKELTDAEISYYVSRFSPLDKAGAYGIQEWIGFVAVQKIEGSFFTVMGLPVHLVYSKLRNWGV
jgi:septum formation protein